MRYTVCTPVRCGQDAFIRWYTTDALGVAMDQCRLIKDQCNGCRIQSINYKSFEEPLQIDIPYAYGPFFDRQSVGAAKISQWTEIPYNPEVFNKGAYIWDETYHSKIFP